MPPLEIILNTVGWLVLPAIGVIALTLGIAGRRYPTRPLCSACGARLAYAALARSAPCAVCGRPVSDVGAPRPLCRRPRWRAIALGCAMLGLGAGTVLWGNRLQSQRFAGTSSTVGAMNTTRLVTEATNSGWFLSSQMIELEGRVRRGDVIASSLRNLLSANFALGPDSSGAWKPTDALRGIAALAMSDGEADDVFLQQMLECCFDPPSLDASLASEPPLIAWPVRSVPSDSPLVRLAVLKRVTVEGVDLPIHSGNELDLHELVLDVCDGTRQSMMLQPLSPGKHNVSVEVEEWLTDGFSAARIRGHDGQILPTSLWPAPIFKRTKHASTTIEVPQPAASP